MIETCQDFVPTHWTRSPEKGILANGKASSGGKPVDRALRREGDEKTQELHLRRVVGIQHKGVRGSLVPQLPARRSGRPPLGCGRHRQGKRGRESTLKPDRSYSLS